MTPPLKTSPAGYAMIEDFEGLDLNAYNDGTGTWTIGYGHTSEAGPPLVAPGLTITEPQADTILANDLAAVEADVNRLVTATINQNQFDALVSFHFNTGALGRSNVLAAVNSNNFKAVPSDLLDWCYGGGRLMAGLVTRRKAEGVLFMTPPSLGIIATAGEYTIGTNAAMPVAQKFIAQLVPSEFQGMIPLSDVQEMVAQIVVAALDAVDVSRTNQQAKDL